MNRIFSNLLAVLQLGRVALVFTAIGNAWVVALFSRAFESDRGVAAITQLPLWQLLATTAGVAAGLYVFGMSLNDVMDARHDRTFAPGRPIPAGRLHVRTAISVAFIALILAIAAAVPLGWRSIIVTLACAMMIVFYDTVGKHLPAVGVLTLGVIRATHMLIANPLLGFCWPVWLTMSHVIGVSAASHKLEGKRPRLTGREVWGVVAGWVFLSMMLMVWMGHREAMTLRDGMWLWVGPTVAAVAFIALAIRTVRRADGDRAAGGGLMKIGLMWLIVYDAAWLFSAALWWQGLLVAAMLPTAWTAMRAMRAAAVWLELEAKKFQVQP